MTAECGTVQAVEVVELDLASPTLEAVSLMCGHRAASAPAVCPVLHTLLLSQPRLALGDIPGLSGLRMLTIGSRAEVWPGRASAIIVTQQA